MKNKWKKWKKVIFCINFWKINEKSGFFVLFCIKINEKKWKINEKSGFFVLFFEKSSKNWLFLKNKWKSGFLEIFVIFLNYFDQKSDQNGSKMGPKMAILRLKTDFWWFLWFFCVFFNYFFVKSWFCAYK